MRTGVLALIFLAAAAPAAPQAPGAVPAAPPAQTTPRIAFTSRPPVLATPPGAFAASLVLPGSGQAALGLRRWPLFLAVEAGLWWLWADARGDYRSRTAAYRDVAWEAARIHEGPRVDAGWSYYEAMSHYAASGAFDAGAAAGLQPEEDPATYNGSVWTLARGIYLPGGTGDPDSPEYGLALAWYRERAAGPGFLWSWAGRDAERARFLALIDAADDANRMRTTALGLVLANHLVAAVDALVAARVRDPDAPRLDSAVLPGPRGPALRIGLRVPLTNGHGNQR